MISRAIPFTLLLLSAALSGCSSGEVRLGGEVWVSLVLTPREAEAKAPPKDPAAWWKAALKAAAEDPETAALLSRTYGVPVTLTYLEGKDAGTLKEPERGLSLWIQEGKAEVLEGPLGKRYPVLFRSFRVVGIGRGIHDHPERGAWRLARESAKTPIDRAVVDFPLGAAGTAPLRLALEDYVRRALPDWRVVGNQHGPPCFATRDDHARYVEAASRLYREIAGWHDH